MAFLRVSRIALAANIRMSRGAPSTMTTQKYRSISTHRHTTVLCHKSQSILVKEATVE